MPGKRSWSLGLSLLACCAIALMSSVATFGQQPAQGPMAGSGGPEALGGVAPPMSLTSPVFGGPPVPSAEQLAADARSRREYAGLGGQAAVALAERVFGINHPSWVAPGSESGTHVARYLNTYTATETHPDGKQTLVQSTVPLQVEGSSGPVPVSLALRDGGEAYLPAISLVPISISKDVATGVSFASGVSVAPASASHGEAPTVVGNRVVYPGTATDTDFIAEPVPQGAELSWQLLSENSPQENSLKFALPQGASLQMSRSVPGGAEVTMEGRLLLLMPPAGASQADGEPLAVSYSVDGDVLTTHVDLSGNVEFPVLVDPEVIGWYGEAGGDNAWQNWYKYTNCGGFGFPEYYNLIQTGTNPNQPVGCYGEWYTGVASSSPASITRVDVSNVTHQPAGQSSLQIGITESNGKEIWTDNGYGGAMGTAPLVTAGEYVNTPMAFCADGAGGHDGGEQPLCNENDGGKAFYFLDDLWEGQTVYNYVQITAATIRYIQTTPPTLNTSESRVYKGWTSYSNAPYVWVKGEDSGVGVSAVGVDYASGIREPYKGGSNGEKEMPLPGSSPAPGTSQFDPSCYDPFCPIWASDGYTISQLGTGVWTLGPWTHNAVSLYAEQTYTAYIDKTAPTVNTPSWEGATYGDGPHTLSFSAQDGSSSAPQSGVEAIITYIDGRDVHEEVTKCPRPEGVPSSSCFTLNGAWTLDGEDYGAGQHTITLRAQDWLGNASERSFHITIEHPVNETQQVGPGTLNLRNGSYMMSTSDVSVSAGVAGLEVSRTYDSQSKEAAGPLGPDWTLSTPDTSTAGQWQSLEPLSNGNVEATTTDGAQKVLFTAKVGGGYTSPTGFQTYTLTEVSTSPVTYRITDSAGNYTEFAKPTGASAFMPTSVAQTAGGLNQVTYVLKEGRTKEILGPSPHGVTCAPEHPESLARGCRALTLTYAEKTTATLTESGQYEHQLESVVFTAWNNAQEKTVTVPVARYEYDNHGRLRAEWDPRVSPALKTIYGYNAEGILTALTPPGQQPWAFTYGTLAGVTGSRLLKVTQTQLRTGVSEEEVKKTLAEEKTALTNTKAPSISGSPVQGVRMAVSDGTWTGSPVLYAYQWEDCNSLGGECKPIVGAINPNYTPVSGDVGHTLVAQVTATNSVGSVVAASPPSQLVVSKAGALTQAIASGTSVNAVSCISETTTCVVTDNLGRAFYATNVSSSSTASWHSWTGPGLSPSEAVECPASTLCLMAAGSDSGYGGNMYYATSLGGAWTQAYSPAYGVDAISCTSSSFCVDGQDGYGYFRYSTSPASTAWNLEYQGSAPMKGVFCLSSSFCAIADGAGSVHVATSTSQIESSSWTSTDVNGTSTLNGVACVSTASCVAVDGTGDVLNLTIAANGAATAVKHNIDGLYSLVAVECPTSVRCVTVDNQGNIFVSNNGGETWVKQYSLADKPTSVSCASSSLCATVDTTGHVTAFNPGGGTVSAGELRSPQPGSTVEYKVPVSGIGAPYSMTAVEVEKWAQKDAPAEAAAVFPPDEPQSWPASDYRRASVFYFDSIGRRVNVVSPGGAISTTQYDTYDNVSRTLTPGNRATALKENNTVQAAENLSTESAYEHEGAELVSELGPQHEVKLASGTITQARAHTVYHYDQGEPGGGPYRLVTETAEGALLANGKEEDVHTVKTSYSGQSGLGWELRKPTSVTTEPENGKPVTRTTAYSEETGDVTESKISATVEQHVAYVSQWGSFGAGSGLPLKEPEGMAVDSKGDAWIADTGNDRVQELSSTGEYIRQFGSEGTGSGQFKSPYGMAIDGSGDVWVADMGNNRVEEFSSTGAFIRQFGSEGTGNGQFKGPRGIAIDGKGDVWVTDSANNRVQEFTPEGVYVRQFGVSGTEAGQLKYPWGITTDSEGHVWVADAFNSRVQEFTSEGVYVRKFGASGTENGQFKTVLLGMWIALDSVGHVWVSDAGNNRVQEFSSEGVYMSKFGVAGTENGQFTWPEGLACDLEGHVWVADRSNNRAQEFTSAGTYVRQYPAPASAMQFAHPKGVAVDGAGDVWVADTENKRVQEVSPAGSFMLQFSGSLVKPEGIALDSSSDVWVTDASANDVREFSSTGALIRSFGTTGTENGRFKEPAGIAIAGEAVYVVDRGNNRIQQFNLKGEYVRQFGTAGSGNGQLSKPQGVAVDGGGDVWVADAGNNRIEEFSSAGAYMTQLGTAGTGNGQLKEPQGIAIDQKGDVWVADTGNNRIEELSPTGAYKQQFATAGAGAEQVKEPADLAIDPQNHIYVLDTGNARVQKWTVEAQSASGARATQTVYYTPGTEASVAECQGHPEWANLPCQTQPAEQPKTGSPLPVMRYTYNTWGEPVTTTESSGSSTRTSTEVYDAAGRVTESSVTSSTGRKVPAVRNKYSEATGALVEQSTEEEGRLESLKSEYNTLGQLISYTDAGRNVSTYTYDIDGRLTEANSDAGKLDGLEAVQRYTYDKTTGQLTDLEDSAAGTFTASYDVEGRMTSESYPNGMRSSYAYNAVGQATALAYTKGSATWYEDTVAPSIHGQWLSQQSTLGKESYLYDDVGRLTEVSETPAGKGCTVRLYAYDIDSNRTSQTTRQPGTEGQCATSGGTSTLHSYDEAGRLTDTGVAYEPLGANTLLPASDAGGHALESSYYASGALYSQTQGEQTNTYTLDPSGRILETTNVNGLSTKSTISHYSGAGSTPAWTEVVGGGSSRDIPGIGGSLAAIQTNAGQPVIQLSNLHGDIVGSVPDSQSAESATLTSEPTAFGEATSSASREHGWLGSGGLQSELESGVISSPGGSYVPQLGIHLEPAGLTGAAAQDPVNEYLANETLAQPTGESTGTLPGAIEPQPVNTQIEEEFWANPPWDQGPVNEVIEEETEGESSLESATSNASAASIKARHRILICNIHISAHFEDDYGLLIATFANTYSCRYTIFINAAWDFVGFTPTPVYSSGVPVKNGAFFLELITVGGVGPQDWGQCVTYTYKKKTIESCKALGVTV